jgi:exodeoxyribonuclease V alpha subunit
VLGGPGRFGLRRPALSRAAEQLTDWAHRWRTYLPDLPTDPGRLAQVAGRPDNQPALRAALNATARRTAEHAHPEHATLRAAAHAAEHAHEQARDAMTEAGRRRDHQLGRYGALGRTPDPRAALADLDRQIGAAQHELAGARARIAQLTAEPALLGQPADRLAAERHAWRAARDAHAQLRATLPSRPTASTSGVARPQPERLKPSVDRWATTPGLGR